MSTVIERFPRPVRVIENVWILLPSGQRLASRLWLTADAERTPVPAIIEAIPYRKRDFTRSRDEPMHHYVASWSGSTPSGARNNPSAFARMCSRQQPLL